MPVPDYDTKGNRFYGDITGSISVSGSAVLVNGPDVPSATGFMLCAHPSNTGTMWIMSSGLTKVYGWPIRNTGQSMMFVGVHNLNQLTFGADVGGEKIQWIIAPP
jgi:hypothetical protein